jgi:lon-related putative ATP-dependent protease
MAKVKSLSAQALRARLDIAKIPCQDSRELIGRGKGSPFPTQPRALHALTLGMNIADRGYNIYVAGEPNLGRSFLVRDFIGPLAAKGETPQDRIYVYNFDDPDKPRLIDLPAGMGRRLKNELAQALTKVRKEAPARFETELYVKRRNDLVDNFQKARELLVGEMETEAAGQGFNLDVDEQGSLTLYPLVEGKLLSAEEFERLDPTLRKTLKSRSEQLMNAMTGLLRKIAAAERGLKDEEHSLDVELVREILAEHLEPTLAPFLVEAKSPALDRYAADLAADMIENLDQILPKEQPSGQGAPEGPPPGAASNPYYGDGFFIRYEINTFVDNSETKGAPLIVEDHPTAFNLLGCIEREAEMGALITDFTLIKAGALHRAHKGYLILHIEDMLQNLPAWEGLLRALRSGQARIEDAGDNQDQAKTKTIEPDPVPIELKVLLIGTDSSYEMLLDHEDRFPKLFKIKAHMQETTQRTPAAVKVYLKQLARIIEEAAARPFGKEALAGLVDYSSRLANDQKKLTLKMPLLRELIIEADATAKMRGKELVDGEELSAAIAARDYRANLYEEEFMEEYDREMIRVQTSGESVGRVNGLSVSWFGDYEFGLPHQIACTVGVGEGGIVDLEREAQLGGPIHTKAMMILKSYLIGLFAQNKPVMLTGSLCFEQSYAHVEGDSASGAELAALLSALSSVPIRLSLAFTGAVNQSGAIMAVGGVTRKIEGFFEVCRRRGLNGAQGVILPADNRDHLMLKDEVVEAVAQGKFHIFPVRAIEEAMELLTGLPAGKRLKNGCFSGGSLYRLVDERLTELVELAERYGNGDARRKRRKR